MNQKLRAIFGLKWNPFSPNVPAEALWRSPRVEHFCWRIEELVREGGFALITGDPGTGKSVALRILAHYLDPQPDVLTAVLTRPQSSLGDFYRELGDLFGLTLAPHNRWTGFKTLRQTWLTHVEATRYRPYCSSTKPRKCSPQCSPNCASSPPPTSTRGPSSQSSCVAINVSPSTCAVTNCCPWPVASGSGCPSTTCRQRSCSNGSDTSSNRPDTPAHDI